MKQGIQLQVYFKCISYFLTCTSSIKLHVNLTHQEIPEKLQVSLVYDVQRHFQQYFSYIVVVSLIGGGKTGVPREKHRPVTSY